MKCKFIILCSQQKAVRIRTAGGDSSALGHFNGRGAPERRQRRLRVAPPLPPVHRRAGPSRRRR